MKRSSGVLLNISSLPGEYGIGGFSHEARNIVEQITSLGFRWWQILPVTTVGMGDSPYSGFSAFAGNFLYVDASPLIERGLLTKEEAENAKYRGDIYLINYAHARWAKRYILECAFYRLTDEIKNEVKEFALKNAFWLEDYALYMTLKEIHGMKSWSEWEEPYRTRDKLALKRAAEENRARMEYYRYEQYEFFRQWTSLKNFTNEYGLGIFGDMPIYVCYDSADVWANPQLFQLDGNLKMKKVAGVPPDYFASEGQLWGNPLYDYKKMEEDDFLWFTERIVHNLKMYDMLRIDHFRGLCKYWAVDAESKTAKEGKWLPGPGMKIWKALDKKFPDANIVAEDLGQIDGEVRAYLEKSGFYGMRVMQFGFDGSPDNIHLPHNYIKKCVSYTATHDNDTTLGWLMSLDENTRRNALEYVNCDSSMGWASGGGNCKATKAFIRALLSSSSDLTIIPMQDLCGYGSDTRMNVPGVAEGNWRYRTNYSAIDGIDRNYIVKLNTIYGRINTAVPGLVNR